MDSNPQPSEPSSPDPFDTSRVYNNLQLETQRYYSDVTSQYNVTEEVSSPYNNSQDATSHSANQVVHPEESASSLYNMSNASYNSFSSSSFSTSPSLEKSEDNAFVLPNFTPVANLLKPVPVDVFSNPSNTLSQPLNGFTPDDEFASSFPNLQAPLDQYPMSSSPSTIPNFHSTMYTEASPPISSFPLTSQSQQSIPTCTVQSIPTPQPLSASFISELEKVLETSPLNKRNSKDASQGFNANSSFEGNNNLKAISQGSNASNFIEGNNSKSLSQSFNANSSFECNNSKSISQGSNASNSFEGNNSKPNATGSQVPALKPPPQSLRSKRSVPVDGKIVNLWASKDVNLRQNPVNSHLRAGRTQSAMLSGDR